MLITGLWDRPRKLILKPDGVAYENKDPASDAFTWLQREDITGFKHRVETIVWYKFPVGQRFIIALRGQNNNVITIAFANYFGFRKEYFQDYSDIIETIWEYYIQPIVEHLKETFVTEQSIRIGELTLQRDGIQAPGLTLGWEDVGVKEYGTYFALYKTTNPHDHLRIGFDDWEAEFMLSLIRRILDLKKNIPT